MSFRTPLLWGLALSLLVPIGSAAYDGGAAIATGAPLRPASPPALRTISLTRAPTPATLTTILNPSGFDQLGSDLNAIAGQSGGQVRISLQELSGPGRHALALYGSQGFYAASEYKLPLLMATAQQVATGQTSSRDSLCYDPADGEDGWFTDYEPGSCFSRSELAMRAGRFSDNTAARILVRYLGGPDALNTYARASGMTNSTLWDPNTTTAGDLTALWVSEATGQLGGRAAQQWLYPFLTHTTAESGIPAGLPSTAVVIHKTGNMYGTQADAALVRNGRVEYVLTVCVAGLDEATAWGIIQHVSARVWQYEAGRPDYPPAPIVAPPAPKLPDRRHQVR